MRLNLKKIMPTLFVAAIMFLTVGFTFAQDDTQKDPVPKQKLRSGVSVTDTAGGEGHISYVIRVRQGQSMTVRISWRRKGDNHAEFTISKGANFFSAQPVKFGQSSNGGKLWKGKIPATGKYYIYVTAFPTVRYTLRATVK